MDDVSESVPVDVDCRLQTRAAKDVGAGFFDKAFGVDTRDTRQHSHQLRHRVVDQIPPVLHAALARQGRRVESDAQLPPSELAALARYLDGAIEQTLVEVLAGGTA